MFLYVNTCFSFISMRRVFPVTKLIYVVSVTRQLRQAIFTGHQQELVQRLLFLFKLFLFKHISVLKSNEMTLGFLVGLPMCHAES